MPKIIIAKAMAAKKVVTNDGEDLGKLVDIEINEVTGKIEFLLIDPNPENKKAIDMGKDDGMLKIPYSSVLAASDFVIVDRRFY